MCLNQSELSIVACQPIRSLYYLDQLWDQSWKQHRTRPWLLIFCQETSPSRSRGWRSMLQQHPHPEIYIKCYSWHHYHNEVLPLEIWWDRRREGTWWCHWPTGASRTWWRFHRRWWTRLEISPSLPRLTNTFQPEDLVIDMISDTSEVLLPINVPIEEELEGWHQMPEFYCT